MTWKELHGPVEERIERHYMPEPNTGCWLWFGAADRFGYGRITVDGKTKLAHRISFELANGTLSADLELDHLCRTPACINPAHLQEVTHAENVRRGNSPKIQKAKTHCPHGHEYTPENTRHNRFGGRFCWTCNIENGRKRNRRLAEARSER